MASSHQNIDIPRSSTANDEAALGVAVEGGCYHLTFAIWVLTMSIPLLARLVGPVSDPQLQIPSTLNRGLPHADTIFSLYNKDTLEFDSKHIENWRDDANSLIILVSHRIPLHQAHWVLLPDRRMVEWFGLSGHLRIPGTVLHYISNQLSRCLGLLPLSDLSTSA